MFTESYVQCSTCAGLGITLIFKVNLYLGELGEMRGSAEVAAVLLNSASNSTATLDHRHLAHAQFLSAMKTFRRESLISNRHPQFLQWRKCQLPLSGTML